MACLDRLVLVLNLAVLLLGAGLAEAAPVPPQRLTDDPRVRAALAQLDAQFAEVLAKENLPGMSAGVVYDQELIWSKGYGYADIERKLAADAETVYDIGSVTKMFNATMLMQLRDAGKLSLDDPIEKYLPEFHFRSRFPDSAPPTFRQVVAHVGGLPREYETDGTSATEVRQPPADEVLAGLGGKELTYPPLTAIHYSNLGIYLMGQALQRIAGQPYKDYVREHILLPLGMTHTDWDLTEEMKTHYAVGYRPAGPDGSRPVGPPWIAGDFGMPAGGLYSSVEDLAKFLSLQFRGGPVAGGQILSGSTLREMRAPIFLSDDWRSAFGVGWGLGRRGGHLTVGHGGGNPSYCSYLSFAPDLRFGVVILINQETPEQYPIGDKAMDTLIPAFEAVKADYDAQELSRLLKIAEGYQGRYRLAAMGVDCDLVVRDRSVLLLPLLGPGEAAEEIEFVPEDEQHLRLVRGFGYNTGEVAVFSRSPNTGAVTFRVLGLVLERVSDTPVPPE